MLAIRTEQIWLQPTELLADLTFKAKNLYNSANYKIRQEFILKGRWMSYSELFQEMKETEEYATLPAHCSQQVMRRL